MTLITKKIRYKVKPQQNKEEMMLVRMHMEMEWTTYHQLTTGLWREKGEEEKGEKEKINKCRENRMNDQRNMDITKSCSTGGRKMQCFGEWCFVDCKQ